MKMIQMIYSFLVFFVSCFVAPVNGNTTFDYPHLTDNPYLDRKMQVELSPYLLPLNHPIKSALDRIFSQSRVIENERTLLDAGFSVIAGPMPLSFVIVARHPMIPGYVIKLYLDSETRQRKDVPHWRWLMRRCEGARGIRKIIKKKKIRYFSVPDKWLYILPVYPYSSVLTPQPVVLVETDMQPESFEVTERMWATAIKRKHLDELYSILRQGYGGHGTIFLTNNVPYTKLGKFAFTDTEDPQKEGLPLKHIKKYLSKEMQEYWESLISEE